MGNSDRAALAAPIVERFYKLCFGSETMLLRTAPLFAELAAPDNYLDLAAGSGEGVALVVFLAEALNYLTKRNPSEMSVIESLGWQFFSVVRWSLWNS